MNTEQSRAIALGFLENFSAGRVDVALGLLGDDATWWVGGTPGQYGMAGTYTKLQLLDLMQTRQELYELLDYDPVAESGWV